MGRSMQHLDISGQRESVGIVGAENVKTLLLKTGIRPGVNNSTGHTAKVGLSGHRHRSMFGQ